MSEYGIATLSKRYMEMDVSPQFDGYSGVEIVVDEETSYFAGETSGRVITISNPWGTQEQADNILAKLQGFQYQPFTATGALLDPAAELGDGVVLNGLYSGLYKISKNFSSLISSDIAAPQDEEIDHEYPYEAKENREINRKFASVESEFAIQSNEIAAKVSQTGGDNSSFGWSLVSDHFSLFSGSSEVFRVDSSGAEVRGVIRATSGMIGGFNIGSKAIYNNISDFSNSGNKSSGVYLGTDGIRLGKNFTVNSAGNVSANNMVLTGTLNVGGTNITANNLRLGAERANGGYGTWNGTSTAWNNATKNGTGSYPGYFTCGALRVNSNATVYGNLLLSGSFVFGGRTVSRGSITDGNGVVQYVLKWA